MYTKEELARLYRENEGSLIDDYYRFLRFQSVSSEPQYKSEVLACAEWAVNYLAAGGFAVESWPTSGYPVIFAEYSGAGPDKPTVLFYGHYDVQPVDPVELWSSPPFEPTVRDGEVYARGAQDNKGQIFYTMAGLVAALRAHGSLPVNVKLVIEGEEEVGSNGLNEVIVSKAERLAADHVVVVDVGFKDRSSPSVVVGVRGIITFDVEVIGANTDLHSGTHGGIVYNPNRALVEILASLWDEHGRVQIPGFYDAVVPMTPKEREVLSSDFDANWYRGLFAAEAIGGERDVPPFERAWLRPTVEINGMAGGYHGAGFKTVIPAKAIAKVSCRLVPNQEPDAIGVALEKFLTSKCPTGLQIRVSVGHGGRAIRSRADAPIVDAARAAIAETTGGPCGVALEGGSIPIITELARAAGGEVVLIGYAYPEDNMHAPNEHFGLDRMRMGFVTILRLLENVAA